MLTVGSLFSGIGGLELGLERTGKFRTIWQCEIDPWASAVLKKHWPGVENLGDITKIDWKKVPRPDIICGGFPCPSFSHAGKRGGFSDERGRLFFEVARAARILRPKILLLENVDGLRTHNEGRTLATVLDTVGELGYWHEWQVLDSQDWGLAQHRERVFIIGHLRGERQREIFPFCQDGSPINRGGGKKPAHEKQPIAQTLRARDYANQNGNFVIPRVAPTLTGGGHSGGLHSQMLAIPCLTPFREKIRQEGRRMKNNGEPSFTLTTKDVHGIYDGKKIRRLTETECERLQGFPDGWTNCVKPTHRYRLLGNAVSVNVSKEIGKRLSEAI